MYVWLVYEYALFMRTVHSNSYAMRGVPVRYKNPIYVPDLLKLPVSWTKPTLPSSSTFFVSRSVCVCMCGVYLVHVFGT